MKPLTALYNYKTPFLLWSQGHIVLNRYLFYSPRKYESRSQPQQNLDSDRNYRKAFCPACKRLCHLAVFMIYRLSQKIRHHLITRTIFFQIVSNFNSMSRIQYIFFKCDILNIFLSRLERGVIYCNRRKIIWIEVHPNSVKCVFVRRFHKQELTRKKIWAGIGSLMRKAACVGKKRIGQPAY